MEELEDVYLSPMPESPYVKPVRLHYSQGARAKSWDLLHVHDSVAVVVLNVTRRTLVLVKQFRPAVYYNSIPAEDRKLGDRIDTTKYPASLGITLEMCAGIVDKSLSLEEIAREEVLEECGYQVPAGQLERIISYRSGVGEQGALQTLFYCEVTDDMKVNTGGGVDDELIDVLELSIAEAESLLASPGPAPLPSPPSFLFALSWFLAHRAHRWRKSFERECGECKEGAGAGAPSGPVYDVKNKK